MMHDFPTESPRRPRVLLRSSWQTVNIGDVAHTPGLLALLERFVPEADVILWASPSLTGAVARMEKRRFPSLRIVKGTIGDDGRASSAELAAAVAGADLLLHGSGPSLVASADVAAFARHTGKPYGVYGITYGSSPSERDDVALLGGARFVFFRDSVSLGRARDDGVRCEVMAFAPDAAFACDLRDDVAAASFLRQHALDDEQFLCCIPRLRYTPYWEIHGTEQTAEQRRRADVNAAHAERDLQHLRDAITAVVRQTPLKVLLCPEDQSHMRLGKTAVLDRLPADMRGRVVWREAFWLPDEALSTYVRSAGLFGFEMHSPILCVGGGVPAIVCRSAEQTSKGFMWRDIGLGDWLFDADSPAEMARLTPTVLTLATDRAAALRRTAEARRFVRRSQRQSTNAIRSACGLEPRAEPVSKQP